jgi:hypothetical protein
VLGETLRFAEAVRRGAARVDVERSDLVGVTSDDPAVVDGYVRSLLEGAEAELAIRLIEEPRDR